MDDFFDDDFGADDLAVALGLAEAIADLEEEKQALLKNNEPLTKNEENDDPA